MGFLTSMFTPRGFNAAKNQSKRHKKLAEQAAGFTDLLAPQLRRSFQYGMSLEPQRRQALQNTIGGYDSLLLGLSPGNVVAGYQRQGNALASALEQSGRRAVSRARGAGMGDSLLSGMGLSYQNQAAQARNRGLVQGYDPALLADMAQKRVGVLGAKAALLEHAQGYNPFLAPYMSLGSMVYGEPRVQVQPGLGEILGGLAGQVLASNADKLFPVRGQNNGNGSGNGQPR